MTRKEKEYYKAKELYNLLDGFVGLISEQGWEGTDRYWNDSDKTFLSNLALLKELNKKLGDIFEEECISYGILQSNNSCG